MDISLQIIKKALLNESEDGFRSNFACSPLSISLFLAMCCSAGKGEELENSLRLLGFNGIKDLHATAVDLMEVASSGEDCSEARKGEPVISFVNGVWIDERFALKPFYSEILENIYRAEVKIRDIRNQHDSVESEVNSWTEEKTKGLIKKAVEGYFDSSATSFFMNAMYFKGTWENQFDLSNTEESSFHLINGESVKVSFMRHFHETFSYKSFNNFKLLSLPYQIGQDERRFSMYFFLPDEVNGHENLVKHLGSNPSFLNQEFDLRRKTINTLMIPKFEIHYGFWVSTFLEELGVRLPSRDILDSIEVDDGRGDFDSFSSLIYHKACIKNNEEGTEAVAMTIEVFLCDIERPPRVNFIADHPFMFMIREDKSRVPFFVGAVVNPLANNSS